MTIAYIALGGNLTDPTMQLRLASQKIDNISLTKIIATSSMIETAPIGPQDQPNFMNQVIAVETALAPLELLHALQAIENQMGRVRLQHWGPRIIDCDILLFGEVVMNTQELTLPHPEMRNRDFVLELLADCQRNLP